MARLQHPPTNRTIRPLFKEHCTSCHNPDKKKADLDLTTYADTLKGGSGGEIVKAGVPDSSVLYLSVIHDEDAAEPMPPKKPKLPETELALIREWIQGGLVESAGGKSMLREISFEVTTGSSAKPAGPPPMPDAKIYEATGLGPAPNPVESATQQGPVNTLVVSPWAPLLARSGNGKIRLIHTETGEALGQLPFPEGTIHDLKFSPQRKPASSRWWNGRAIGKSDSL